MKTMDNRTRKTHHRSDPPNAGTTLALMDNGIVDAAILDVTLNPDIAFLLVDQLEEQDIPFVFVTLPPPAGLSSRYSGYALGMPNSLEVIGRALFGRTSH